MHGVDRKTDSRSFSYMSSHSIKQIKRTRPKSERKYQHHMEGIEGEDVGRLNLAIEVGAACNRFFASRGIEPEKFNHFDKE